MTTYAVRTGDTRSDASIDYALKRIEPLLGSIQHIEPHNLRLKRRHRRLEEQFKLTPRPLIDAWRVSTVLMDQSGPGDVIVISDDRGFGGLFALAQPTQPLSERRQVWTVAADSAFLEMEFVSGVHEGLPMPLESQIDWEIVQYRWSDRVLATSQTAVDALAQIGVHAELVAGSATVTAMVSSLETGVFWAPDPVSRRANTGEVLRAMTGLPSSTIVVSDQDDDDRVWLGTTWDALRHPRAVLDDRVSRSGAAPENPAAVILGDPFLPPNEQTVSLVTAGIPVVVPADSVASLLWGDAPTWSTSDDLVRLLSSGAPSRPLRLGSTSHQSTPRTTGQKGTVSVGIPIFRDVRFLEECIDSVLAQDHTVQEIVLIDDGSTSGDVNDAMESLARRDRRIRTIKSEHRGVCVARNTGLEAMIGDCFLFIDSDDVLQRTFLSTCLEMLNSDERLWAVATWTEFFGAYEGIEAKPPFDARVGKRENPIVSTAALVDMGVREQGIRFAPDLAFLYCEDWHFWSQIVAAGGRLGLVPEPLVKHRVHPASGGHMRTDLAHAIGMARATAPLVKC